MNKDLISVLIPAYNHENYIEECINSIMNQTYEKIEVIIVNDGSTDNTANIINQMKTACEERFENFITVSRDNEGIASTCHELLSLAKGDYVFVIASDDVLKENALECLHHFLSQNDNYVLAVGDNEIIDHESKRVFWNRKREHGTDERFIYKTFQEYLKAKRRDIDFDSLEFGSYENLLKGNHVPNGYLIRKNMIDQTDAYNKEAPIEDWYLMLQLSKIGKMKCLSEILFSYRWHASNTIKNKPKLKAYAHKAMSLEINNTLFQGHSVHTKKLYDFLNNNKKKTIVNFGKYIHIYNIKNIVFKKTICMFFGKSYTWVRYYNSEFESHYKMIKKHSL